MKLLNIKIDGFGKFINYSFSFDSSIVVIEEDNSFGKTTIAEFIKAMFYGLPSMGAKKGHGLFISHGIRIILVANLLLNLMEINIQ